jgi:gliding motility-associated-like protein
MNDLRLVQLNCMKYIVCIIILFVSFTEIYAQREANIWHFGNGNSLDFNSGAAVQTTGSSMSSFEGCTAFSDAYGNLLFYSNGGGRVPAAGQDPGHIWNKNNGVMYDMQGLEGGGFSAAQSSVIVPAPGEPNVYYLFTVDEIEHYVDATPAILAAQPNGRGFRYFKIDMELNGGLGEVTVADVQLNTYSLEGLCAIRHANETDYWILINQDTTGIGVYKVTSAGVSLANVFPCNTSGIIKASPSNGIPNAPCCNRVYCAAGLFEFDLNTGILSNPTPLGGAVISAEFSHNSNYLYTSEINPVNSSIGLYRYDILGAFQSAQPLVSTRVLISDGLQADYMQLAPDGKIYFTQNSSSTSLGTIDCPNSSAPSVSLNVFSYGTGFENQFFSLPNFPSWIFYNFFEDYLEFGADTLFICPGDSIVLDAGPGTFWSWGGDCYSGPPSTWPTNSTRAFTVTQPGTYSATVTGFCPSPGASDQITFLPCPTSSQCETYLTQDTLQVCFEDTAQLQINNGLLLPTTQIKWLGGNGTFLPSDTVPEPEYIPTAAELSQGFVNLTLQVTNNATGSSETGKLIAYDHVSNDLIFEISTIDGSIDSIQDNVGNDWVGMGYETSTSNLYGLSAFSPFTSVNIQTGASTNISFFAEDFYAAEYDNVHGKLYAVGNIPSGNGDPVNQFLCTINTSTGAVNVIGNLNLFTIGNFYYGLDDGINGLAYNPILDVFYGVSYNGKLFSINVNNGVATFVGNTTPDLRGLAYNFNTDELWGINSSATLYKIDKNTGNQLSSVACQQTFSFVTSLTYAPDSVPPPIICSETLQLQFRPQVTSSVSVVSCSSYNWNGSTYSSTGTYSKLFPNGSVTGCDSTAILNLNIASPPSVTAASIPGICGLPNATATATATGGSGGYVFSWSNGATGNSVTGLEPGNYLVIATDQNGCTDSAQVSVFSTSASGVSLVANDTLLEFGDSVTLEVLGANTYLWAPPEGLSCTNCPSVIASPLASTIYQVTGVDSSGCGYLLNVKIEVEIDVNEIFVPDAFSPNSDGINDKVFVRGSIREFSFSVFNRWGEQVFRTQNQSQGWDGSYRGKELDTGVFVYYLTGTDAAGKSFNKKGNITLVK